MNDLTIYDFVVVGGGTAGCVVAARLSEDPGVSVLLLEAGDDERRPDVENPDAWPTLLGSDADWGFETTLQPGAGRPLAAPRGKVLGGSGSINCMAHLRGHRSDFDEWSRMGAHGWDYAGVLPYFKRSEHVPGGDERYRGTGGPLQPQVLTGPHPIAQAYLDGAVKTGHHYTDDFNGQKMVGAGWLEWLILGGRRESTATAYLRPAASRANLTIQTSATATGLMIADGRCHGVRYIHGGVAKVAAAGEVVLSAGAVGSPHLLMLSGVGPVGDLEAAGITVSAALDGVGTNLQDHTLLAGINYHAERPLDAKTIRGCTVLARTSEGDHGPDLNLNIERDETPLDVPGISSNAVSLGVGHMRCRSRGSVKLRSSDPLVAPLIDPAYLTERYDIDQLIAGLEMVDRIVRTGVFDEWGGHSDTTALLQLDSHALDDAIRASLGTYYHLSGTCRMGSDDDAVVSADLKVRGVENLRVADASVMPVVVSCNTNAASVMIGERAADLVRDLTAGALA